MKPASVNKQWMEEIWRYIYKAGEQDMAFRACVILKRQNKEPDEKILFELIKLLNGQRTNLFAAMEQCRLHHSPPLFSPETIN